MAHAYRRDSDRVISLESQIVRLVPNKANGHKDLGLASLSRGPRRRGGHRAADDGAPREGRRRGARRSGANPFRRRKTRSRRIGAAARRRARPDARPGALRPRAHAATARPQHGGSRAACRVRENPRGRASTSSAASSKSTSARAERQRNDTSRRPPHGGEPAGPVRLAGPCTKGPVRRGCPQSGQRCGVNRSGAERRHAGRGRSDGRGARTVGSHHQRHRRPDHA